MKAANNVLTSFIKLRHVFVKLKQTNQNCSPSKLANQSMLNGAIVIQMVNNSFSESNKNVCRLIKINCRLSEEIDVWALKIIFSLDFAKCLCYSEVQRNSKVVNV